MIRVSREIRFPLLPSSEFSGRKPGNSWAGGPATQKLVPRLALRCVVEGPVDPKSGYLCNIKLLDSLLRDAVAASVKQCDLSQLTSESLLVSVAEHCRRLWTHEATIVALELDITPFLNYRLTMETPTMISVTEQFEFSAAHRLHCNELSDEENREVFGKCNHPNGHGHNYVIAVTLTKPNVGPDGQVIDLGEFEQIVNRLVIDRLDHKHLNLDEPHFATVNPTVENIAIAIHGWLDDQFGEASLASVRVYETPKTWAEYPLG